MVDDQVTVTTVWIFELFADDWVNEQSAEPPPPPLPPFPDQLTDNTIEIGLRFKPISAGR